GIVTKHLTETPVPPTQRAPHLSIDPTLECMVLEAMQKDRDRRPRSAFEMRERLEALLRDRSGTGAVHVPPAVARAVTIAAQPSVAPPSPTLAGELVGSGEMEAIAPRRNVRWIGVALMLGAVAVGGFLILRRGQPQTQPLPQAT